MNVQIIRGTEVNRPTPTPLTSSILDQSTVETNEHWGLTNNEGLWPSYNCLDTLIPTSLCPDPIAERQVKEFVSGSWIPAFEFAVYGGVQCGAVGLDKNDMNSELRRVFAANEGKGIERALLETRFVANDEGSDTVGPFWDAPVDVTPDGATITLLQAVALLEGYAASVYAGMPTLHLPRAAATLLSGNHLTWIDGKAYTKSGSKVAIGGGYDNLEDLQSGVWDLYATGEVYIERSEQISITSIVVPGDGSGLGSGQNGISDNTVLGLAERMYRVGVDCFVAKATATIWTGAQVVQP